MYYFGAPGLMRIEMVRIKSFQIPAYLQYATNRPREEKKEQEPTWILVGYLNFKA